MHEDLSNWYIRRSRRRFWDGGTEALQTLWYCLVTSLRVVAPIMPFLTEHLWRNLVSTAFPQAPLSIFLAGWPETVPYDAAILRDVATVRQVVNLGHQARVAAKMRVRQPLRQMIIQGADHIAPYVDMVADELRIKEVTLGPVEATQLTVRPNLRVLGPRLGQDLVKVRSLLQAGKFEELPGGRFRVGDVELGPDEVLVDRHGKEGWHVASADGVTVALDVSLDDELRLESRVYDMIHRVNRLRKEAGLEISDRITLALPKTDADLLERSDWLMAETLSTSLTVAEDDELRLARA